MPQVIFFGSFVIASACSLLFACRMFEALFRQWLSYRRAGKTRLSAGATLPRYGLDPSGGSFLQPRGYDSPEVFWEDSVIRLRRLKRKIQKYSKKTKSPV